MEKLGRSMLRARLVEDKLGSLYRAGRIVGGVYLGRGQEAFSGSGGMHLRKGDVYAPLIRDMAGRLAFGRIWGPAWVRCGAAMATFTGAISHWAFYP
jgi:TPP-dependent pyruvate/acetoin dehydrogenase alpha subunit